MTATVTARVESSQIGAAASDQMKAIVQEAYGEPEAVLRLRDVAKPVGKDREVVVRVHAASIHVGDWMLVMGVPYIARPAYGLTKPKSAVPGTDISGTVEAIGAGVRGLRVGDEVFGWCAGAFAEYVAAPEDQFVTKPANLSFEQAAAVGVSASTALQLLRDQGQIQPGQKVLINGASGGLGTFAVQIARAFGAEVTGACSAGSAETVRTIGADHVIDYTREDFTQSGQRYDFILDNVANHSLSETRRALTPTGKLQSNNGTSGGPWFGTLGTVIEAAASSMFNPQQLGPTVKFQNRADLLVLRDLIEAGKVSPVIDTTYPLSRVADAIGHVGKGHSRGTVVIAVEVAQRQV
jgi:NADPH:quinone reductase-like Zn-dependent oxidoreductase